MEHQQKKIVSIPGNFSLIQVLEVQIPGTLEFFQLKQYSIIPIFYPIEFSLYLFFDLTVHVSSHVTTKDTLSAVHILHIDLSIRWYTTNYIILFYMYYWSRNATDLQN